MQNIHRERRHDQLCVARRDLQNRTPRCNTHIQRRDPIFLCVGAQHEQGSQEFHDVDVRLPGVETSGAKVYREDLADGPVVVEVHRNRLRYISQTASTVMSALRPVPKSRYLHTDLGENKLYFSTAIEPQMNVATTEVSDDFSASGCRHGTCVLVSPR